MSAKNGETTDPNDAVNEATDNDRVVSDVLPPPRHPLASSKLFPNGFNAKPDLKVLVKHLHAEGRLHEKDALNLIHKAAALLKKEPNMLKLYDPITVCGDVHGQFFDLLRLLEAGGDPADTQYLFLGDYVDRGCFSTEVVFYLFAHKICYPKTFFMLRGNHECRHLTSFFNFKDECLFKYNIKLYDEIMNAFDCLPIAATINNKFLCVHGGLSPDVSSLDDIQSIHRFSEVPRDGPFCDLLWADPIEARNGGKDADEDDDDFDDDSIQEDTTWFSYNETRQCSYVFGADAVQTFLKKNKLTAVIRAHEAQFDGYKMQMINNQTGIPRVITIFSAPNYCDVYKNKGACLKFDNELLNIRQFVCSPHPYYLPNFMDVFQWSLPFVAEKVTDMLANVISFRGDEEDEPSSAAPTTVQKRSGILREKVLAISKLVKMYRVLREENELIIQLKQLTPNHNIPFGLLRQGPEAIKKAISSFSQAKKADRPNEARPEDKGVSKVEAKRRSNKRRSGARNIVF